MPEVVVAAHPVVVSHPVVEAPVAHAAVEAPVHTASTPVAPVVPHVVVSTSTQQDSGPQPVSDGLSTFDLLGIGLLVVLGAVVLVNLFSGSDEPEVPASEEKTCDGHTDCDHKDAQ